MDKAKARQRAIFMAYNLVTFTIIFTLFGFIIFNQVQQSLFRPLTDEFNQSRAFVEEHTDFLKGQLSYHFSLDDTPQGQKRERQEKPGEEPDGSRPGNPGFNRVGISMRIQLIIRSPDGEILNPHMLGRFYWEDLLDEIPFSSQQTGSVQGFQMDGGSYYQQLTFPAQTEDGSLYYVQLMTNVDGEHAIVGSFLRILIICAAAFVLLSISASYVLSQRSMIPLLKSWDRQAEFVGNASHELRTPLTIIQNKLEGMLTAPHATILDRADDIAISLSETRRLSKLTSDLMTLARADSNATQLEFKQFSLDAMIQAVSEPYGELAQLEEKKLTLQLEYGGELRADQARLHELMVILLDNALKYTQEGDTITLRTFSREGRAVLEVIDTGIGIREETLPHIFERFYREEKARSREKGGSGLGLSIAKWIVEAHGGSIRARPNQPAGTIVEVRL